MAMKALICPQCQSQLEPTEEEMERGYAECPACGTIVEFHDVKKVDIHQTVEHTGQVEFVNTKQAQNRINLAQRAYDAQNYQEAYDYYTKVLEDIPEDIISLYRKGICAVRMSSYDNLRIPEFTTNVSVANSLLNERLTGLSPEAGKDQQEKDNLATISQQVSKEVNDLLRSIASAPALYVTEQGSLGQCQQQASRWGGLARLYLSAAANIPAVNYKEQVLNDGIAFCDKVSRLKIKYLSGTTRDKNGKVVNHYSNFKVNGAQASQISEVRAKLAEEFNNLPARKAKEQLLQSQLNALEEDSKKLSAERDAAKSKLDESINQFWNNNPELRKQRSKKQNMTWIIIGIGLALMILSIFVIHMTFLGILLLALSVVLKIVIGRSSAKKMEQSIFPEEIKALQESLAEAEKKCKDKDTELKNKKKEISAFEAEKK